MYSKNVCRKDCLHYENGTCKFAFNAQNSIFHTEQKKCIYYASAFPKEQKDYKHEQMS